MTLAMPLRAEPPDTPTVPAWRVAVHDWDAMAHLDWPGAHDEERFEGYVYQTREFLETWMATIGRARGSEGHLIVLSDGRGRDVLHLALVVERDRGCRVLRFPDASMADYNAPLLRKDAGDIRVCGDVWRSVLTSLPRLDAIDFVKMPQQVGDRPNPLLANLPAKDDDVGCFLAIDRTAAEYFGDPSRRQTVKRLQQRLRKLERTGPTTIGSPAGPDAVAAAASFIELHKGAQFRRTLGFDQFDKPGVRAFLRALVAPEALGRFTQLTVMEHDGAMAAAQLDFRTPRRHQGFITTFDPACAQAASPGRQVTMRLIERAFVDGSAVFDLGHGENAFKAPWTTGRVSLLRAEEALTWRGRLYILLRGARRRVRSRLAAGRGKAPSPAEAAQGAPAQLA